MTRKLATVKESVVEAELKRQVEARGGICEKVRVIGQRGFFDRLVVLPGPRIIFVEIKRPQGGRMTPHQIRYAARFRLLGLVVALVRNEADIDKLLK